MSTVIAVLIYFLLLGLFISLAMRQHRKNEEFRNQSDYDDSEYICPIAVSESYVKAEDADAIVSIQEKSRNE